jgi:ribosomal protein L35
MKRHILTKKNASRLRGLKKATLVSKADTKNVRSMLPYA